MMAHVCVLATLKAMAGLLEPGIPGRLGLISRNGEREQRARKNGKKGGGQTRREREEGHKEEV